MGWKPQFSGHNALGRPADVHARGQGTGRRRVAVAVMEPSTEQTAGRGIHRVAEEISSDQPATTYSLHGFNAAKIFVEAAKQVKGEITADALAAALEGIKGYNTGDRRR